MLNQPRRSAVQVFAAASQTDKLARRLAGRSHAVHQIEEVIRGEFVLGPVHHLFGTYGERFESLDQRLGHAALLRHPECCQLLA